MRNPHPATGPHPKASCSEPSSNLITYLVSRLYNFEACIIQNENSIELRPWQFKQESIPVGCVPPASVATTKCQHQGVYLPGVYFLGGRGVSQVPCFGVGWVYIIAHSCSGHAYPLPRHTHPPGHTHPKRDLRPGIPNHLQKGHGSRHTHPHPPPLDRQTLVKTLPSRNYHCGNEIAD